MKLYQTTVLNGALLEERPFLREFELEGCLATHPELLSLNDDALSVVRVIALEAHIRNGRKTRNGRPDMLVAFEDSTIGVVELKRGRIDQKAYDQLRDYLSAREGLAENKDLLEHKQIEGNETLDLSDVHSYVGVIVGTEIDNKLLEEIEKNKNESPIFAVVLRRYSNSVDTQFVTSTVYSRKRSRNYCKYHIGGSDGVFGKCRLVHEIIRRYVSEHSGITFAELADAFPKKLRGGTGCFEWRSDALIAAKKYKRHFLAIDEILHVKEGEIAVSTQWGHGNIEGFIAHATNVLHYEISEVKESKGESK